uniref:Xylulose kinase-1 n=1 Tax=Tanacetum cinerariifolium TaxID=118510 RepID=A0A6L2LIC8_TANCI|nr:hypothetical protein [Tanacetum cinerariifolium]
MAPLTFADTHTMVAYLSKSDTSEGFDQIMDFHNAHTIQYALVVNPIIYVSCIKQFWAMATFKKVNDVVQLRALFDSKKVVVSEDIIRRDLHLDDADGVECLPNEEIFKELAIMGYEKPPPKLTFYKACFMASAVICLARVAMDNQVDDITIHNTRYTFPTLTQKVFANMKRVGKGFFRCETPLFASMLVQPQPQAAEEVEIPIAPSPHALHDPTPTPYATPPQDQPSTPHDSPPQEQPTTPHESSIPLLTTLMETSIDADEDVTLVDVEKDEEVVTMDAKPQGRINQEDVNAASKGVSAAEPTIAQRLHDEEVQKAAARDKQGKADMERALELQRQYDDKEENIDWSAIAEQESFKKLKAAEVSGSDSTQEIPSNDPKEMTEEDVQNMLEIVSVSEFIDEALQVKYHIIDWEIHNKSFKKLKAAEVSGSDSTQEIQSNDPKEMTKEDV